MSPATRARARGRAAAQPRRCEYCQLRQEDSPLANHHVEHIRPMKHGGDDDHDNLALACIDCNLHKGSNLTGIDPESDGVVELYNPRRARWNDHFRWDGIRIIGKTPTGRTTITVLNMNSEDQLSLRRRPTLPSVFVIRRLPTSR